MARLVFAFIVFVHGLIHLLGFVKEWHLARVDQLTGKTLVPLGPGMGKAFGALWLLICLAFLLAGAAFLMKKDWWWMVALATLLASQLIVVIYWADAFAGTIPNVIILVVVVVSWAGWSFDRAVRLEATTLLAPAAQQRADVVTADMISNLPPVVQRWLQRSGVVGRPRVTTARLKQRGTMRTKPDGRWMPFEAEQYFTVDPPAFIWKACVRVLPFVHLAARDSYVDGQGRMMITLLSLVPLGDSTGPELNQGALLRYLVEASWFPSALLAPYITWEPLDSTSARATMSVGGTTASGVFTFTGQGDLARFEAQRYGEFGGTYRMETWSVATTGYKAFDGVRVGNAGEATWKLKTGDWTWLRMEITELEFNKPEVF